MYCKQRNSDCQHRVCTGGIPIICAFGGITPSGSLHVPWRHQTVLLKSNHTTHLSNSCRYLMWRTFSISTLEFFISSSACLYPHVSPLLSPTINLDRLRLKQILHTRPHCLRIDLHPNPAPLQRNRANVQIPWIRSNNRGFEQTSFPFFTQILHTTS